MKFLISVKGRREWNWKVGLLWCTNRSFGMRVSKYLQTIITEKVPVQPNRSTFLVLWSRVKLYVFKPQYIEVKSSPQYIEENHTFVFPLAPIQFKS